MFIQCLAKKQESSVLEDMPCIISFLVFLSFSHFLNVPFLEDFSTTAPFLYYFSCLLCPASPWSWISAELGGFLKLFPGLEEVHFDASSFLFFPPTPVCWGRTHAHWSNMPPAPPSLTKTATWMWSCTWWLPAPPGCCLFFFALELSCIECAPAFRWVDQLPQKMNLWKMHNASVPLGNLRQVVWILRTWREIWGEENFGSSPMPNAPDFISSFNKLSVCHPESQCWL